MKKIMAFILGLVLIFLAACSNSPQTTTASTSGTSTEETTASTSEIITKTNEPTIFFHGYSGTINSFKSMISRIETDGYATKELVLTVATDGSITSEGTYTNTENNPIVQVLFADNKNNEWNQAEWVKDVLEYLQTTYNVQAVNIVGHSMGGVSAFRYLTAYGYDTTLPKVTKFVGIGAPFNDFLDTSSSQTIDELLANGPTEKSQRYLDYAAGITNVAADIPVLLLAGQMSETDLSDETVPLTSALAPFQLLQTNGNSVSYQIFMGIQHSQLHEEPAVDQVVEKFLWG
ncbi:alpha/beta fold hydrolase [Enterococcus sp. HY326]|uniref:alpha/beta fold hydrolase n=1 Tax=Enterococcus sp. HY326 TaxID=2971265 RepID=UPI003A102AB4